MEHLVSQNFKLHMSFYIIMLLLETYSTRVKGNTRIEHPSPRGTISVKVNTNTNRQHCNTILPFCSLLRCNHGHVITWGYSTTTWSDIRAGTTHLHTLSTLNLYVVQYEPTSARLSENTYTDWGMWWRSWLRHCATSQKILSSIPDGVTGIFHWHNPSGHIMILGLTQTLIEMSTRNISCGVKATGVWGWQPYHLHVPNIFYFFFLSLGALTSWNPLGL